MPISNIGLLSGATGFTVTGGTLKTYTPDGQSVTNGLHVADASVSDFRVRPHITWKNRNPQRNSDGTYSKGVRTQITTVPYLDVATGKVEYVRIETTTSYSPVIPAATIKDARYIHVQTQFDSEAENFNTVGEIL